VLEALGLLGPVGRVACVPGRPLEILDRGGEVAAKEVAVVARDPVALAGVEAELLIVPRNVPHVWALTNELVVTVSGDLNRAQLVRITESLRQAK
jgi:hypothetical protein